MTSLIDLLCLDLQKSLRRDDPGLSPYVLEKSLKRLGLVLVPENELKGKQK